MLAEVFFFFADYCFLPCFLKALRCTLKAFSPESRLGLQGAGPSETNDELRIFSESLITFPNVGLLLLGYSGSMQGVFTSGDSQLQENFQR